MSVGAGEKLPLDGHLGAQTDDVLQGEMDPHGDMVKGDGSDVERAGDTGPINRAADMSSLEISVSGPMSCRV